MCVVRWSYLSFQKTKMCQGQQLQLISDFWQSHCYYSNLMNSQMGNTWHIYRYFVCNIRKKHIQLLKYSVILYLYFVLVCFFLLNGNRLFYALLYWQKSRDDLIIKTKLVCTVVHSGIGTLNPLFFFSAVSICNVHGRKFTCTTRV